MENNKGLSVYYTNNKGLLVENTNKEIKAVNDVVLSKFQIALKSETVSDALLATGAVAQGSDYATQIGASYNLYQLRYGENYADKWKTEKHVKTQTFIRSAETALNKSRSTIYKFIAVGGLINERGFDLWRPDGEKIPFPYMRAISENKFFKDKDKNQKDGEYNILIDKVKDFILKTVTVYDRQTGKPYEEYILIPDSTKSPDEHINELLQTYYKYVAVKDDTKNTRGKKDGNTAKTDENNAKGEITKGDEKTATTPENKPKKPLSIQALYNAVVALCNENGKTINDIIKYDEKIKYTV